ncbi:hypothetical protein PENTCL1PPCAC_7367, partial [Pristionchus entomophagus]
VPYLSSHPCCFILSNCRLQVDFRPSREPAMETRPEPVPGPAAPPSSSTTVYPAVESIDRSSLPPPPYAAALSFPKRDEGQLPPSYQLAPNLAGPPIIVYVDDGTGERCLMCGSPLRADISFCALFCVILTVILTFPLGLVLLCCLPCLFTRKCVRCGEVY